MQLSVVIMCKNEQDTIGATISAAQKLTPHITVVDTGSIDNTLQILAANNVTIVKSEWLGFGPTKNVGITAATHDWILSLDADEIIDEKLISYIKAMDLADITKVYKIEFINYLGDTPLKYGEWSGDKHIRIFNRKNVKWNDAAVHEELQFSTPPKIIMANGFIHHKTISDGAAMHKKFDYYARLNAEKYFTKGTKYSFAKLYFSPLFNFLKNYVFKLGFLDGAAGWIVAKENFIYTYKKYYYLQQLLNK